MNMQIPESGSLGVESRNWRRWRLSGLAKATECVNPGAMISVKSLLHDGHSWGITNVMNSHRSVQPCWLTSKKSDKQTFLGKAFGTKQTMYPVLAHLTPFNQNSSICSCVLNPGLGWFFKDLKIEAPVPHQAVQMPSPSPSLQTPVSSPSPNKTLMKPQEKASLISLHDFPADSASALLSPEAHKNCKLIIQHN